MWKKGESVQHLISGCEKLAQREYNRRLNNVARIVHWDLFKKNGLVHRKMIRTHPRRSSGK